MLYVILGILILIVSFVVALISLVYEQRKVEERTKEEDVESGLVGEDIVEAVDVPEGVSVSEVTTTHAKEVDGLSGFANSQSSDTGRDDVWWEKMQTSATAEKNIPKSSDEEESIAQIRRELARLVQGDKPVPDSSINEVDLKVDEEFQKPSRIDTKRRNLLMGEFSLGDIKKRD